MGRAKAGTRRKGRPLGDPPSVDQGDCADWLASLPDGCADAVIADPPYGIGLKSDGNGRLNPWANMCNASFWYRSWIEQCRRLLAPSGCLWSFLNWRSVPIVTKAACDAGWPIESMLVWDKQWIGTGSMRGLRPSYELAALWCREDFVIEDRGVPDIRREKWVNRGRSGHPAQKPLGLIRWLVSISTVPGGLVVDPFAGSGTTGVACVELGRRFLGCEMSEKYVGTARGRIGEAAGGDGA